MPQSVCDAWQHLRPYPLLWRVSRGMAIPGARHRTSGNPAPAVVASRPGAADRRTCCASAEVMLVDAIRHGTTTLIDHHASPNAIDGSLDVIAEAVEQAGLRAVLCYEVTDRDGKEARRASPKTCALSTGCVRTPAPWRQLWLARQPDSLRTRPWKPAAGRARWDRLSPTRFRAVGPMSRIAWLTPGDAHGRSPDTHGISGTEQHRRPLHPCGCARDRRSRRSRHLGHPSAALEYEQRGGRCPVETMLGKGIKVCLGNDGFSNAMWEEWKAAYLVHKSLAPIRAGWRGYSRARWRFTTTPPWPALFPGVKSGDPTGAQPPI